jgi:hypothetical protein
MVLRLPVVVQTNVRSVLLQRRRRIQSPYSDVNASSPSNSNGGIATESQEVEMRDRHDELVDGEINRDEPAQNPVDFGCYSVTARWQNRAEEFKALIAKVEEWCKQSSPKIEALRLPKGRDAACCTICALFQELNALCEIFLESKRDLIDAERGLDEAQNNDRVLKLLNTIVTANTSLVYKQAALLHKEALEISKQHFAVENLLTPLSAAGNKTSLVTSAGEGSRSSAILSKTRFGSELRANPRKFDVLSAPPQLKVPDIDFFLHALEVDQLKLLAQFYKHLQYIFEHAKRLEVGDEKYKEKIEHTILAIMEWYNGKPEDPSTPSFFIPGCVGQETKGAQPILYAIMAKMTQILGLASHVTQEQGVPKIGNRSGHYVDFVVTHCAEEYFMAILPAMLGVPIEVKPISRKGILIPKLLLEAQDQVVGHLAKRAMY